jgi:catechol 2,3-dioxygenase-like lactoylglutathione lyase family enzyme
MSDAHDLPTVTVRFVFNVCNDIAATRRFYVELLGMREGSYMDTPEFGWLAVQCEGFQMMWFRADEEQPVPKEFTMQPGWEGGTLEGTSWAVGIPEDKFPEVYEKLREAGAPMLRAEPEWRQDSYWGLSVLDPMGVTVEVYTSPKERPESTEWPG